MVAWEVEHADEVILEMNGRKEALSTADHLGQRDLAFTENTNLVLIARNQFGEVSQFLSIEVQTPTLTPTPTGTSPPATSEPTLSPRAITIREEDGITMVYVPAGEFLMGSSEDDSLAGDDEKPQHGVKLDAFWIDQTEVTNAAYQACVEAQVCRVPHRSDREEGGEPVLQSANRPNYFGEPTFDLFPVIFVSWDDARTYCEWRGKRLPTEVEWERAAKGPNGFRYPWGNEPPSPSLVNYANASIGDTGQVMSYPPAVAHEIYDMAGNVWEWTNSRYEPYPYRADDGREDPTKTGKRVLRGGSWRDGDDALRTTKRDVGTDPDFPLDNVGFRCAKDG